MLALLLSACDTPAGGEDPPALRYPVLTLSEAALDFGDVAWGDVASRTVLVANEGEIALGVDRIAVADGREGFSLTYDACAIECDGASAKGDTGGAGTDTGGHGRDPIPCGGPEPARFVLPPGCRLPVTVSFTGEHDGDAHDVIDVVTVSDPCFDPLGHVGTTGSCAMWADTGDSGDTGNRGGLVTPSYWRTRSTGPGSPTCTRPPPGRSRPGRAR